MAEFLDVAKIMEKMRVPRSTVEITPKNLDELIKACADHCGREIMSGYMKALATFSIPQQGNIRCLLETIRKMMEEKDSRKDAIISELSNILTDVRCFPDHYLLLQQVCLFTGCRSAPDDKLHSTLIRKLWEHLTTFLPSQLLQIISTKLFANCADNMATHANACISYSLDVIYNLFGATLLNDPNCPASALVLAIVSELSLPYLTLGSTLSVIQSLCEEDPWDVVRRLLQDDDATVQYASDAAEGKAIQHPLFDIANNTVVLTPAGIAALIAPWGIYTHQALRFDAALSHEEAAAMQVLRGLLADNKDFHVQLQDLSYIRETFLGKAQYNHFFRMNFHIATCFACHVAREDARLAFYQCREDGASNAFMLTKYLNCMAYLDPSLLLDLLAEDPSLLKMPFEAYGSFTHFLAECKHDTLALLLKRRDIDKMATWHLQNSIGYSWLHVLSQHKGALFVDYADTLSEEQLKTVLCITNASNGRSVCYTFACCNAALFGDYACRNPTFRRLMGPIFNREGWSPCHHLAERYAVTFRAVLRACANVQEMVGLLSLENPINRINVCYMLATSSSDQFAELFLDMPLLRPSLIALHSPDGWSPFHHLAEKHGAAIERILCNVDSTTKISILNARNPQRANFPVCRMLCSQADVYVRIMLRNPDIRAWLIGSTESYHEGWSPLHVFSEHYGTQTQELLKQLPTSDEALAFLSLRNSTSRLPVCYMFCSKQIACFMSLMMERPELISGVQAVHTHEGWSVFHHIAEKYGPHLVNLVASIPTNLAAQVLAERSSSSQLPVSYMLCVHFPTHFWEIYREHPELRPALILPTNEGWTAFHHLAEKHAPFFTSSVLPSVSLAEAMELLALPNTKRNNLTVAHFFASLNSTALLDCLATMPELRQRLLTLGDHEGWTVYHTAARVNGARLKHLLQSLGSEPEAIAILQTNNLLTSEDSVFQIFTQHSPAHAAEAVLAFKSVTPFKHQFD